MELSTYALHDNAALVLCRGHHGTRKSPRCLGEADNGHIRTSVGRRLAHAPGVAVANQRVSRKGLHYANRTGYV